MNAWSQSINRQYFSSSPVKSPCNVRMSLCRYINEINWQSGSALHWHHEHPQHPTLTSHMNCLVNFTHWRTRLGYIRGFDLVLSMKRKIFRVYKRIKRNIFLSLTQLGLFNVCFTHRQRCLSPSFQKLSLIPRSVSVGSNHTLLGFFLEPRTGIQFMRKKILHPREWLYKKN